MADEPVIRVQQLGKCYQIYDRPQDRLKQSLWRGKRQFYREFWALRDISFEVGRGETVGVIGRNGSGKSTLLQLVAGTLSPTAGSVAVRGRVAALLELGSGFNPEFTGRENVVLNATILGLSREEIDARFDSIVAFADIGDFIDQPVKIYSSGMVLRLAFAVSVSVDPDILIVDEALAVGDLAFQYKCMDRLDRLTKSGTTLLFVSHDIHAVKAFCSRVIYLSQGRAKAMGTASDMAELFLLDMKDEQKRALEQGAGVAVKPALGREKAFAFGTAQGRVVRAVFTESGTMQSGFATGDRVDVDVEVEYDATVASPAVSLILCDYRMIEIGGRYLPVARNDSSTAMRRATVRFSFPCSLNTGNYFLTLRLEDRISDSDLHPVDKQVGALAFMVTRPAHLHFIGVCHMPIDAVEVADSRTVPA